MWAPELNTIAGGAQLVQVESSRSLAEVTDGALAAGTHSPTVPEGRTSRSCSGERTQKCFLVGMFSLHVAGQGCANGEMLQS